MDANTKRKGDDENLLKQNKIKENKVITLFKDSSGEINRDRSTISGEGSENVWGEGFV